MYPSVNKVEKPKPLGTSTTAFVSSLPWQNLEPDCLVICCSDHRFEPQTRELLKHLGFQRPHMLQIPSGPVLTLPLASAFNFLSKAVDKIVEKIVELKKVRTIICIGHHDCGAYKAGNIHLVNLAIKRLTGESVEGLQHEHLASAARRIKLSVRDANVRAFFAAVSGEGDGARVRFEEIPVK
jgi:carbonic anhydrase